MKIRLLTWLFVGVAAAGSPAAQLFANPISVNTGTLNIFRDNRGQNDVHTRPGGRFPIRGRYTRRLFGDVDRRYLHLRISWADLHDLFLLVRSIRR
jgi:hypothetical protein